MQSASKHKHASVCCMPNRTPPCACMKCAQKCRTNACQIHLHTTSQTEGQRVLADERTKHPNRTACQNAHKRHRIRQHALCMRNLCPSKIHAIYMQHAGRRCRDIACLLQTYITNACKTTYMQNASKRRNTSDARTKPPDELPLKGSDKGHVLEWHRV